MKTLRLCVAAGLLLSALSEAQPQRDAQANSAKMDELSGRVKKSAIRPEAQACRDRIKELAELNEHVETLTPEKLTSVQKEIGDCVYAEAAGLSKDDVLAAYRLRDSTGKEVTRRIREAAVKTVAEDNAIRDAARKVGQGFLDEDKAYRELVQGYNSLIDSYNSLVMEYRTTVEQNGRFLDRMQENIRAANYECELNALKTLVNSAPRRSYQPYRPPAQIHCTTQNMPPPVPGLASWSYTNCH